MATKKSGSTKKSEPTGEELFASGQIARSVEQIDGVQEVADNHREYGNMVNSERAIPDICDGLLAVQRRSLWTSKDLHMSTDKLMGSAEFVGSSMRFHPHADTSLYDSMARLTQLDRHNIPLFAFQGDNGSMEIGHAALRYTYVKPNPATLAMLGQSDAGSAKGEIDFNGVPMVPNFNKEYMEPTTLPAMIPAYLTNGHGDGLGVGVAANIPKHNLTEVLDLALHLLKLGSPNIRTSTLLSLLPGPDFPPALVDDERGIDIFDTAAGGLEKYLTTGKGSFIMQAPYHTEQYPISRRESGTRIVFDQLPYGTKHEKVAEAFDKLVESGRIPDSIEWNNTRHPSADIGTYAVEEVLPYLYAYTPLRTSFSVNMAANVPDDTTTAEVSEAGEMTTATRTEKSVSAVRAVMEWLDHRRRTIRRSSARKVEVWGTERANLDLTLLAIQHAKWLTEVSLNNDDPAPVVSDGLDITVEQAQYLLDKTTFSKLSARRRDGILERIDALTEKIDHHQAIVDSNATLDRELTRQIKDTRKQFGHPRHAVIHSADEDTFVKPNGPMVKEAPKQGFLAISERGAIRWCLRDNIARATGSDYFSRLVPATAADSMYAISASGQVWRMPVADVPKEPTRIALHMVNHGFDLDQADSIIGIYTDSEFAGKNLALLTDTGRMKVVSADQFTSARNGAKPAATLDEAKESRVVGSAVFSDGDTLGALTSTSRFSLCVMTGDAYKAKGAKARASAFIRPATKNPGEFIWFGTIPADATGFVYQADNGFARFDIDRDTDAMMRTNTVGTTVSKLTALSWCTPYTGDSDVLSVVSSEYDKPVEMSVGDLKASSRNATMRRVTKVEGSDEVYATPVLRADDSRSGAVDGASGE